MCALGIEGRLKATIAGIGMLCWVSVEVAADKIESVDAAGALLDGSALVREKEYLILDVNKELGMVILNGGRRDGVKPGLMFSVIKGDKSVALVQVVSVRSAIAGAVIQGENQELPKVQDRAVLVAGSKN